MPKNLHNSENCSTFAVESPTPGFRGWEMSPLGEPKMTKDPSRGFQDILKRRLLRFVLMISKLRNFQNVHSGLSNDRCPTGYRWSLCAYLVHCLRIYVCAHAYLNYVARRIFIFGVGFALSVLMYKVMRRPRNRGTATVGIHVFLYAYMHNAKRI